MRGRLPAGDHMGGRGIGTPGSPALGVMSALEETMIDKAAVSTGPLRAGGEPLVAGSAATLGLGIVRYAVVLVLLWIGAMKFTEYEALAIQGLVASSPLMSWLYDVLDVRAVSNLIGAVEIAAGVLIAAGPISARAGVVGSLLGIGIFATTLTFLITAPGWEASLGGFPALSVVPGQFLLKDAVLLGAAIWMLGESLGRVR